MKRKLSLLVIALLIVAYMVPAAFAAGTGTVSAPTVTAQPGETVELTFSVNTDGLAAYGATVSTDSMLTFESLNPGALCAGVNGNLAWWYNTVDVTSGTLFTVEVTVSASAVPGTKYPVYVNFDYVGDATCNAAGEPVTMSGCVGYVEIPCDHASMTAWSQTKAPTCSAEGEERRDCNNCDYYETRPVAINANAHSWGEWKVTTAATCSAAGVETRTCKHNSAHTETRATAVDANAHSWGEWKVTTAATCSAAGVETRTCKHNSAHTETRAIAINANAHSWGEWKVTKAPTCIDKGEETRVCAHDKNHVETRAVDALGHDFNEKEWVPNDTHHYHVCTRCDAKCCEAAHTFKWVVGRTPTKDQPGYNYEVCEICGWANGNTKATYVDPNLDDVPQTGDPFITAGAAAVFATMFGAVALVIKRKTVN